MTDRPASLKVTANSAVDIGIKPWKFWPELRKNGKKYEEAAREIQNLERNGLVDKRKKRASMETRMGRTSLSLHNSTTKATACHTWNLGHSAICFIIFKLQIPGEENKDQL